MKKKVVCYSSTAEYFIEAIILIYAVILGNVYTPHPSGSNVLKTCTNTCNNPTREKFNFSRTMRELDKATASPRFVRVYREEDGLWRIEKWAIHVTSKIGFTLLHIDD
jgi:hypothetical protein